MAMSADDDNNGETNDMETEIMIKNTGMRN